MSYLCIFLIKIYRIIISPLKIRPSCRFYPTCSSYSISAFKKYGFLKGLYLSFIRIIKCNPFCIGGYDPLK